MDCLVRRSFIYPNNQSRLNTTESLVVLEMASQQNPVKRKPRDVKDTIPPKPKRPLTIFNLFSKLERNYIIQSSQKRPSTQTTSESTVTESSDVSEVDPYFEQRPERYKDVILPPDWFKVGRNKNKRRFHESHGVISFKDLSKAISDKWNTVDDETRQFCEMIYAAQLEEYRKETEDYANIYGEEALNAQKRTYKKQKSGKHTTMHTRDVESDMHAAAARSSQLQDDIISSANVNVPQLFTTNQSSGMISRYNSSVPSDHDMSVHQLKYLPNTAFPFGGSANDISSHSAYQFPLFQNSLTANSQMHSYIGYQANHPSLQFSELENRYGIDQATAFKQPTQHSSTQANHPFESSVLAATSPRLHDKSDGNSFAGNAQPTLFDSQLTPGLELAQQGSQHYPATQENFHLREPVLTVQQLNSSNLQKARNSFAFDQTSRDKNPSRKNHDSISKRLPFHTGHGPPRLDQPLNDSKTPAKRASDRSSEESKSLLEYSQSPSDIPCGEEFKTIFDSDSS